MKYCLLGLFALGLFASQQTASADTIEIMEGPGDFVNCCIGLLADHLADDNQAVTHSALDSLHEDTRRSAASGLHLCGYAHRPAACGAVAAHANVTWEQPGTGAWHARRAYH